MMLRWLRESIFLLMMQVICSYAEFINRKENELNRSPHYDSKYTLRNPNFNDEMKREMIRDL